MNPIKALLLPNVRDSAYLCAFDLAGDFVLSRCKFGEPGFELREQEAKLPLNAARLGLSLEEAMGVSVDRRDDPGAEEAFVESVVNGLLRREGAPLVVPERVLNAVLWEQWEKQIRQKGSQEFTDEEEMAVTGLSFFPKGLVGYEVEQAISAVQVTNTVLAMGNGFFRPTEELKKRVAQGKRLISREWEFWSVIDGFGDRCPPLSPSADRKIWELVLAYMTSDFVYEPKRERSSLSAWAPALAVSGVVGVLGLSTAYAVSRRRKSRSVKSR